MFERLLRPIRRKIQILVNRAVVSLVENSDMTQRIQIKPMKDEVASNIEHFEEYGFSSFPFTESEALTVFVNGNRAHGIVVKVHDRRYRPTDLQQGEVCIYTDEDSSGHRIHLKRGKGIEVLGTSLDSHTETVDVYSKIINVYCDTAKIHGGTLEVLATAIALGCAIGSGRVLADERIIELFNNHVHSGIRTGNHNTGTPTTVMSKPDHFTSKTEAL